MSTEKNVAIEFGNHGGLLINLADTYPSLLRTTGESVQNSLDIGALTIAITVNLKSRCISVRDNGTGVNENDFNEALRQIGVSTKTKGKLGRYGLGLVSALGKCRYSTVVSSRADDKAGFHEWKFVTGDIAKMSRVTIPMKPRPDLTDNRAKAGNGVTYVDWRTEVCLTGVTDNALLNKLNIEILVEHLIANYNNALKKSGAVISIRFIDEMGKEESRNVGYRSYTGIPIPQYRHEHKAGVTYFDLFISRPANGRRSGKVQVGEASDPFRFSFLDFAKNHAEWVDKGAVSLLTSGLFEGDIVDSALVLHSNRQSFEASVPLVNFARAINHWAETVGSELANEVEFEQTDLRLQRIGLATLSKIEELIRARHDMALEAVLRSFKVGTIGRGHTPTPKDIVGKQEDHSLAVTGSDPKGSSGGDSGDSDGGGEPKEPKPLHSPMTVTGPRGPRRTIVKHHSVGLQLSYEMMPGSSDLWNLDSKTGILRINKRHPYFVECLEKDAWLLRLEEHIVINALRLQATPEDWREQIKMFLEDHTGDVVFLIKHSSNNAKPNNKAK